MERVPIFASFNLNGKPCAHPRKPPRLDLLEVLHRRVDLVELAMAAPLHRDLHDGSTGASVVVNASLARQARNARAVF